MCPRVGRVTVVGVVNTVTVDGWVKQREEWRMFNT